MELFWDTVDQLDLALAGKVKDVEKYLENRQFQFMEQTTLEELSQVLQEDEELAKLVETDGTGLYRHVGIEFYLISKLICLLVPRASCAPTAKNREAATSAAG